MTYCENINTFCILHSKSKSYSYKEAKKNHKFLLIHEGNLKQI